MWWICIHIRSLDDESVLWCVERVPYDGPASYQEVLVQLIHVLSLSNLVISVWISLSYSTMIMFKCGQSQLYWNGDNAFVLMPCNWNHSCICLSISTMIIPIFGKIFHDISSCLEYLCVGPPKSIGYWSLIRIMPGHYRGCSHLFLDYIIGR